ncbi:BTB/POZ domain-containing protein 1 [Pleurostoma richardsiae]|uniref:BTB/POZ domain-containing protein 1 n=1 Tax=Pleurostoma richardsiae TaxID=41990 RepID=A0AA38RZI1_9PEZI|nr:BTB/POZ domain-containing protein 1 [Pleurostoma richardsiae]
MSHLLWKYYWEDDVERFRRLLAPAGYNAPPAARNPNIGAGGGSPGAFGTSPRAVTKPRKAYGFGGSKAGSTGLGKAEVNSRDHAGLTILLRAASSTSDNAITIVRALTEHPAIDIYVQDPESGWNPLHRALYAGNISIARLLLEKELRDLTSHTPGTSISKVGRLIKTKDHEGNSPFDLYNSTIAERALKDSIDASDSETDSDGEDAMLLQNDSSMTGDLQALVNGDELFAFGSNKNLSLGLGDQDDRQYPERVYLKRPDHLLHRFYEAYLERHNLDLPGSSSYTLDDIPTLIRNRPLHIYDVVLSKLHSAVLTTDPVSNLYICGVGRGGRLGLGDENTRFTYTPVQGGLANKKVVQVALGQNHTMAVTDTGELWTWGSNAHSQLGYVLPEPAGKGEEPMSTAPRQVFGPLKKEVILAAAASGIHSVAHTGTSLYTWGKNAGQLALMDADSRSLEIQYTPRKVAASLFSCPIVMVSAIDKATTCLLANHTVCIFTSYGYNIVKFPFTEVFTNYYLGNMSMSSRYDAARNEIRSIASGGETIAAVTARGDLFTMSLTQNTDANSSTSTTNPSKIKGAVTQPQCIWSARKDGVRSVDVGEHGSVIISTQSGAVWRRVKRAKAKDSHVSGSSEAKRKDFKFQRVPSVTKVVTVRSSVFGAFAAVRKDSEVMREQLGIDEQSLWDDIAPLDPLRGFKSSEPESKPEKARDDVPRFPNPEAVKTRLGSVAYELIRSPDLESDLERHLTTWSYQNDDLDAAICTSSSPELRIPIHGWILAARSPILRRSFSEFRRKGRFEQPELFTIEEVDGRAVLTFSGLDILSILNLVLYAYEDKVVPVWNYSRQAPALAHRYRQIRSELMKVATRLDMNAFEASVRMQVDPIKSLDTDLKAATRDRYFFEDGDAILELDGAEVTVHSSLLCQRCPFFEGLFNGRSRGLWLASRREAQKKVKIDLKHIEPETFKYVLRFLYADVGGDLFDSVVSEGLDDFTDLVMDVLSVANELMLDRLSQICQHVLGRFVNTRNIAHLLNAISPCAVTEFKDAGLEYICLQIESMLENHLLDELDEDLLLELDEVVRDNQLARFPFAKSGRAELLLHEQNPELAQDIDEERQRRVREMAYKSAGRDDDRKLSSSFKGRHGSLDDSTVATPSPDRNRRKSKPTNEPFSPDLRPKVSQVDLIFDMDEEAVPGADSPSIRPQKPRSAGSGLDELPPLSSPWRDVRGKTAPDASPLAMSSPPLTRDIEPVLTASPSWSPATQFAKSGKPWGSAALPTAKLDLREVLTEGTSSHSALSAGIAAQKAKDGSAKPQVPKMSQKERKKQQQLQAAQAAETAAALSSRAAWKESSGDAAAPPWKKVGPKTPAIDATQPQPKPTPASKPLVAAESSKSIPRRTASPDTRFSGQSRTPNTPTGPSMASSRPPARPAAPTPTSSTSTPLVPHSKSYIKPAPKAEPSLAGLGLADIISHQKRERDSVREAVAKRSLQEIQQEQAFQEWWDAESRRAQEEEAARLARERDKGAKAAAGGQASSSSRGRRGRGGKARGGAAVAQGGRGGAEAGSQAAAGSRPSAEAEAARPRGKGRGGGRGGGGKST